MNTAADGNSSELPAQTAKMKFRNYTSMANLNFENPKTDQAARQ